MGVVITLGQNPVADSIKQVIDSNPAPGHHKLKQYYELCKAYQKTDPVESNRVAAKMLDISRNNDSLFWALYALDVLVTNYDALNEFDGCIRYAEEAIEIAKRSEMPWDVAYFQSMLGGVQVKIGRFYDALENYRDAVEYATKDNELIKYRTAFLTNIGGIYHYLGDDLIALDYFLQSYYLKLENNLTDNLAPSLINIASVYSKLNKFDEALEFHGKAYDLACEAGDHYYRMKALTGLGFDYFLMQKYDSAVVFYSSALTLSDSANDNTAKANILAKLGETYNKTGDRIKAKKMAEEALKLSRDIRYLYGISSFARTLGDINLTEKDYNIALGLLKESIEVSAEIGASDNLKDAYLSVSTLYREINKPDLALDYYKKYSEIRDSLLRHEEADKYTVVQIKYEMEKKGREVENLTHENEIKELRLARSGYVIAGITVFSAMVIFLLVLFFRQKRIQNQQKNIILEQRLLRSQMNPHFIFNTLTAIQKYIFDKSALLASDYLGKFTRLMRFILNSSSIEHIPVEDETDFIENYLQLQKLRFDNRFDYKISIDPDIEPETMMVPPMLLQPFVENAIEHGINSLEKGGLITVSMTLKEDHIIATVEDNGIGRERAGVLKEQKKPGHKSMAMDITRERLKHLNKKPGRNIHFEVTDLFDDKGNPAGTRVTVNIPIIYV